MAKVLTKDATIACKHGPGHVTIVTPPQVPAPKLTVAGVAVIVKADVTTPGLIPDCTLGQARDNKVSAITAGEATRLKIRGAGVMLDSISGQTDKGNPISVGAGQAGQSKVNAK